MFLFYLLNKYAQNKHYLKSQSTTSHRLSVFYLKYFLLYIKTLVKMPPALKGGTNMAKLLMNFRFTPENADRLKKLAILRKCSMTDILEDAISNMRLTKKRKSK